MSLSHTSEINSIKKSISKHLKTNIKKVPKICPYKSRNQNALISLVINTSSHGIPFSILLAAGQNHVYLHKPSFTRIVLSKIDENRCKQTVASLP